MFPTKPLVSRQQLSEAVVVLHYIHLMMHVFACLLALLRFLHKLATLHSSVTVCLSDSLLLILQWKQDTLPVFVDIFLLYYSFSILNEVHKKPYYITGYFSSIIYNSLLLNFALNLKAAIFL